MVGTPACAGSAGHGKRRKERTCEIKVKTNYKRKINKKKKKRNQKSFYCTYDMTYRKLHGDD